MNAVSKAPAAVSSHVEDDLLRAAHAMIPTLLARSEEAEAGRRLPEETDEDFRRSGFYKVLQPARFGGLELSYGAHTRLAEQVGRGCVSSAWALSVTACHSWMLGMFHEQAQKDVWGENPDARIASTFLAVEQNAVEEDDGIRLSGRWRFSSNVDRCQACIVIVFQKQENGPPRQFFCLLKNEQYKIEQTWDVIGLAGSGSNDVVVEGVFVPSYRMLDVMSTRDATTPGAGGNDGNLFHMPLFAPFAHSLVGGALGGAQGMLDCLLSDMTGKTSAAGAKIAEQQSAQLRIAEATAEINAARVILAHDRAAIVEAAARRELPDDTQRVLYRLNTGYAAKLCVQAVDRLLPLSGGRGLERSNPIQRFWRDVHAVAQHIALVWDVQALNYARVRLGFKAMDPRI